MLIVYSRQKTQQFPWTALTAKHEIGQLLTCNYNLFFSFPKY